MSQRRYRWDQGLRVRVLGLLALLIVVMVALGAALTASFDNFTSLQQRTGQTRQNVLNMERAIGTFAEMTSDLRGYILTGQEQFMQPYVANQARMDALLAQLKEASQGNAEQSARVMQVGELVSNWRTQVAEPEIQAVRDRSGTAGTRITSGIGPNYIDEIRATAEAYNAAEQARLQKELETISLASSRVKQVVWFGAGLASLLALGGFWIFARSVTRSTTLLAAAAEKIAEGERGVMVDVTLQGEFQVVAQAFSSMSMTLAAQEQELQAQQEELIAQNEELLAQQDELQARAAALEKQDERIRRLNLIGQALIGSIDIDQVSAVLLDEYLGLYGGSAGLLLVAEPYSEHMVVQVERWVNPAWHGTRILPAGQLARAVQRQEVVLAKYPETTTKVSLWQEDVPVVQEVYIPLVHATRVIGVVVIAFTAATELPEEAVAVSSSVARQGAVALAAALSHQEVRRGLQALQEQAAQVEELNAQLEEERDRTSAQLDIYLSIVSTMRPGAWLTDTAGNLLVVNATFQEFFGAVPEGAGLEPVLAAMAQQLPAGDPFLAGVRSLIHSADREGGGTIQLNNGYVLQWSSAPVGRGSGLVGRLFTFQDVTELAKLDRLKSEFVNTVSHELRTPLTSIMGYLSLVMNEQVGHLEPQQKEFLAVVKRNTDRLSNLINDLLDVQRIEAGRMPLQCRPVQLTEVVRQVADTFRVAAEQKGLKFTVEADQNLPLISADPDRLTQIASNLVSNAVKYTKEGFVRVRVDQDATSVRLIVEDSGVGIAPAEQKRIFEKFFRGENKYAREAGGTGLGLSIVKMLVEEHGGHIRLESEPGKGTRFEVNFPLVLDSPGAD